MEKVGKDGVITVEESKGLAFETEYVEGMQFDRGYISAYFVTDPERMEAIMETPLILIYDKKISSAQDIIPLLEKMVQTGRKNLVIIAEDVDGEALATLVLNKLRGVFNCIAVKAPGFGDRRKAMLQDIAVLTGGQLITEEMGRKLETAQITDLGRAVKVISTKEIRPSSASRTRPSARRSWAGSTRSRPRSRPARRTMTRKSCQERLARLSGGWPSSGWAPAPRWS